MEQLKSKTRNLLMDTFLSWAFQAAPKDEYNGRIVREIIASYDDTFRREPGIKIPLNTAVPQFTFKQLSLWE